MSWAVVFAKHAQKDAQRLAASGLNRLVYQALEAEHTVKVLRMWSHYE